MPDNKKIDIIDEVLDWIETLVLYCFIALLLLSFVLKLIAVDGSSMEPTLLNGQRLIATNLFYEPENGDIVIFNNPNSKLNKTLVKRVIATEGQTVSIDFENGKVFVDGKELDEPYIKELTKERENFYAKEVTVPEGHIFVMGDNRNNSTDSRSNAVGMVPVDCIIGKAVLKIFPFKFYK